MLDVLTKTTTTSISICANDSKSIPAITFTHATLWLECSEIRFRYSDVCSIHTLLYDAIPIGTIYHRYL